MLTIVHGDDTAASRTFFLQAKKRAINPITLEGDSLTVTDLHQILRGGSLFTEEKYIFIESLLTKKKKSAELTAILTELDNASDASVYLWEGKEIDKRTINTMKNATSQLFTLPKSLFQFLDSIKPGSKTTLSLFHKTLESVEAELIFFMIIRQMRFLLAVSDRSIETIDEVKKIQPWQRTKLERQARSFKTEHLKRQYRKLFTIDLAQKTGNLPMNLVSAIDIWLLEL